MRIKIKGSRRHIAVIEPEQQEILVDTPQSALDLAMMVSYEYQVQNFILPKSCITEPFFNLSTGLAGEILQKYMNYGVKMAIVGDFTGYTSKPLHDFIYESNNGTSFFFVPTEEEATEKLEQAG